jgi:hypothetical protein
MFTSSDVFNFVEGHYNYMFRKYMPKHIREQVLYRMMKCNKCALQSSCIDCSCTSPHLFFSSKKVDVLNKWGIFIENEIEWGEFKKNLSLF